MNRFPRIVVTFVYPPIPIRSMDWQAHYAGEEDEQMDIGEGATAAAAVIDLIENHPRGVQCERDAEASAFRRGTIIGRRAGGEPATEAEHFIKCGTCGGWIDCRDLGQVFEHEGPLPHPAQDQPQ